MWVSTKGQSRSVTFSEAITNNRPSDGGLYVPANFFNLGKQDSFSLINIAKNVLRPYLKGDLLEPHLDDICERVFNFTIPLKKITDKTFILELFHGPTLAFKDIGAKFLAECLQKLKSSKEKERIILVATSGDTGAAVASAFYQKKGMKVILLFPKDKISLRQKKQLTCWGDNVHSLEVEGTFDDCQKMVKDILRDEDLNKNFNLTTANSINVGRLLPQCIYYAFSSIQYQKNVGKRASFIIPSGNMGNSTACFWAREMGFPIEKIILSTNKNGVIPSFFKDFNFSPQPSVKTYANAMDVGNPSNMERVQHLFEGRLTDLNQFSGAYSVDDEAIKKTIVEKGEPFPRGWNEILCPHTATAAYTRDLFPERPFIIAATAHPSKFSEVIEPLIGRELQVPGSLKDMIEKPSQYKTISKGSEKLKTIIC
ncbi:MAG: threonine synthase [Bdellovibrionota bacterium]|nr:threonine synthase [Bdellovibrionota bacterium]